MKTGRPRSGAAGLVLSLILAPGLVACSTPEDAPYVAPAPTATPAVVDATGASLALQDLARAITSRDRADVVALASPDDAATASRLGDLVDAATATRLTDLALRYIDDDGVVAADGTWAAEVDVSWAFGGFDGEATTAEVQMRFRSGPEGVAVAGVGGGTLRTPVWMSGPVEVSRSRDVLVVAADRDPAPYERAARAAVPTVRRVLTTWRPRLVVEVPSDGAALERSLGVEPGYYAQIAAVTGSSGAITPGSPIHVFVNPDVFDGLGPTGQDVVLAHEATHVATDAPLSKAPTWLVEGFADYVALRDTGLRLSRTASQAAVYVHRIGAPRKLPSPDDFDTRGSDLGAIYELSWLACVTLAERGGGAALELFYFKVSRGATVSAALQGQFNWAERDLVRAWRDELRRLGRAVRR